MITSEDAATTCYATGNSIAELPDRVYLNKFSQFGERYHEIAIKSSYIQHLSS